MHDPVGHVLRRQQRLKAGLAVGARAHGSGLPKAWAAAAAGRGPKKSHAGSGARGRPRLPWPASGRTSRGEGLTASRPGARTSRT